MESLRYPAIVTKEDRATRPGERGCGGMGPSPLRERAHWLRALRREGEGQARKRDIAELREELVVRLDVLEAVAREHTRILGEHTQILGDHTRVLGEHTQRFDRLEAKLDAKAHASLEQRVAALERKSG